MRSQELFFVGVTRDEGNSYLVGCVFLSIFNQSHLIRRLIDLMPEMNLNVGDISRVRGNSVESLLSFAPPMALFLMLQVKGAFLSLGREGRKV